MAGEKTHATTPRGSDEVQPLLSRQTAPKYRAKTALIAALAVLATLSVVHRLHLVTKEVAEGNETDGDDESTPWSWAGVWPTRYILWSPVSLTIDTGQAEQRPGLGELLQ